MSDTQDVSKITINGQEFDADDAQNLIDLGSRTREAEQKYNTKFENVWPEYNRSQNTVKELEKELQETKARLTEKEVTPAENKPAE